MKNIPTLVSGGRAQRGEVEAEIRIARPGKTVVATFYVGEELEILAFELNAIPDSTQVDAKAWQQAESIITDWLSGEEASMRGAAEAFNQWAEETRSTLAVHVPRDLKHATRDALPSVAMRGPEEMAVWMVYRYFFEQQDRRRLKRCPECNHWFVDKTRNGSMVRCSTSCTNKWWTLERRRAACHSLPGSRRQTKGRVTP
jgi:hypothetical protein